MLWVTWAAVLISAMLLSGCSGQRTLNQDKLKSAATEIISIASEGELFATAAEYRAPAKYAEGHPEYLRKQAQDIGRELAQGQSELDAKSQFDQLRRAVTRLIETFDALPVTTGDVRWQQSRSQLDDIRRKAEEIRRTL